MTGQFIFNAAIMIFILLMAGLLSSIDSVQLDKKLDRIEAQLKENHPCD